MDIFKSIIVWFTALCYTGILFPLTFVIWLLALPFDRQRFVTHWFLVYQAFVLTALIPIWKVRVDGREKAERGTTYVIIANHQSILDILMINRLRYRFKWISKIENTSVPVLGWYLRMAGYITVDRGNEESKAKMLEQSYNCLKQGISIMIFPEGTRSVNGEIGFYKRGAFQLAIQAGIPILPVIIDGTAGILPKHGLKFRSGYQVNIKVLDPVYPAEFVSENPDLLAIEMNRIMRSDLNKLKERDVSL
ncbi:MAG: 1-acyl-sn-glycerol-3-phosphate acyltransferase [Bacteroidales bacterium]|nr:1-acyl-sn-glycerol-3-phosphate acyltransferase [Bacteroidales bacterium]